MYHLTLCHLRAHGWVVGRSHVRIHVRMHSPGNCRLSGSNPWSHVTSHLMRLHVHGAVPHIVSLLHSHLPVVHVGLLHHAHVTVSHPHGGMVAHHRSLVHSHHLIRHSSHPHGSLGGHSHRSHSGVLHSHSMLLGSHHSLLLDHLLCLGGPCH